MADSQGRGTGSSVLLTIIGVIIGCWAVVGFLRWYDLNVDDVSLIRTLFWSFWGLVLAGLIALAVIIKRRRQ